MLLRHLAFSASDHCPLLLSFGEARQVSRQKIFRFEAWWVLEPSFETEVRNLWNSTSGNILSRLNNLKIELLSWAKHNRLLKSGLKG